MIRQYMDKFEAEVSRRTSHSYDYIHDMQVSVSDVSDAGSSYSVHATETYATETYCS